jgi:predicted O-methyltransferase YrrM
MGEFFEDLEKARLIWREAMKDHENEFGVVVFPAPAQLKPEHVRNARVFADRYDYLTHMPKGKRVAEVGVWKGDYSDHILRYTTPKQLHLFDLDLARFSVRERFAEEAATKRVVFHEGDAAELLETLPDGYFDWIYVDAGHDYASVRADASVCARKVAPGGLLVFNDYLFWSHTEARPYGVVQVVNEMCVNEGWVVKAFSLHAGMYCDIAITRG